MKKWFFSLPVKFFALFLAALCFFCAALSGFCILLLEESDGYRNDGKTMTEALLQRRFAHVPYELAELHRDGSAYFNYYLLDIRREIDCEYDILSEGMLVSDRSDRDYIASVMGTFSFPSQDHYDGEEQYQVTVYFFDPVEGSDLELELNVMLFLVGIRYGLIPICFSCVVGFILLMIFLCTSAGKNGRGETKFNFIHRVPLELYLVAGAVALILEMEFLEIASSSLFFFLLFGLPIAFADSFLCLLFVMTFVVRCKRRRLLETTLIGKGWNRLKKYSKVLRLLWQDARLVPKVSVVMVCLAVFDLFLAIVLGFRECMTVFLIEGIVLAGLLIWYAASLQRLEKCAEQIASGNLSVRCDLNGLPLGLRSLGEKMNRGAEGMEKAVEEKIKSERFKTELITNVSHDIKTPLTSIVNFVDLMKKEEIENEKLREYLEVLDRQSSRLKKLTEDLVESAKAASGVLSVELNRCDAGVLLAQATGEYQAQLEEKGLIPCVSIPEEPFYIMADGKRLWRVMDNLFQNIVKYALPGTRVYISLEKRGEQVDLVFRNISASPLSLSGEHLTERFVRGDLSRTTEGSGLGLSIAQSLTELQKGKLTLTVDGDLFKAVVTFDRVKIEM